eukprot:9410069-Pyramimonas_sp.AAC.1
MSSILYSILTTMAEQNNALALQRRALDIHDNMDMARIPARDDEEEPVHSDPPRRVRRWAIPLRDRGA